MNKSKGRFSLVYEGVIGKKEKTFLKKSQLKRAFSLYKNKYPFLKSIVAIDKKDNKILAEYTIDNGINSKIPKGWN